MTTKSKKNPKKQKTKNHNTHCNKKIKDTIKIKGLVNDKHFFPLNILFIRERERERAQAQAGGVAEGEERERKREKQPS